MTVPHLVQLYLVTRHCIALDRTRMGMEQESSSNSSAHVLCFSERAMAPLTRPPHDDLAPLLFPKDITIVHKLSFIHSYRFDDTV
jgi:hypothetical protein